MKIREVVLVVVPQLTDVALDIEWAEHVALTVLVKTADACQEVPDHLSLRFVTESIEGIHDFVDGDFRCLGDWATIFICFQEIKVLVRRHICQHLQLRLDLLNRHNWQRVLELGIVRLDEGI